MKTSVRQRLIHAYSIDRLSIAVRSVAISIVFLFCSACAANLNTGVIDYRFVPIGIEDSRLRKLSTSAGRYVGSNDWESEAGLVPNDSVAIYLLQGFICDFREGWGFLPDPRPNEFEGEACNSNFWRNNDVSTQGEIAVVADVFEMGAGSVIAQGTSFEKADRGRLVYYSEDIRESGQYLNFSNLPLYGPTTYSGGPIFVRLYVLELDQREAGKHTSIFSSLAALGSQAFAPSSIELKILKEIGTAFLQDNKNDVLFEYEFVLDATGTYSATYAPLAVGTLVIMRLNDRDAKFPWHELSLDLATGRLQENKEGEKQDYRAETYFTIKIARNKSAQNLDVLQAFGEFRRSISEPVEGSLTEAVEKATQELKLIASKTDQMDQARTAISQLTSASANKVEKMQAWEKVDKLICSAQLTDDEKLYIANSIYRALVKDHDNLSHQEFTLLGIDAACGSGTKRVMESIRPDA